MGIETTSGYGLGGTAGWTIAGALGGAVAAAAFGLLMWAFDPEIVEAAIPAIYGFDPSTTLGMGLHLLHGAILGVIFGFIVTRSVVLDVLSTDVETEAVSRTGLALRLIAAGFVFGLALWAVLPVIVLPAWLNAFGADAAAQFPAVAVQSMFGHMLFGVVLGLVFAATVDLSGRIRERTFDE